MPPRASPHGRRRSSRSTSSAARPRPQASPRAFPWSRTPPRPSARSARGRSGAWPRSASSPRRTSRAWATVASSRPTTTRWPSGFVCSASTARATSRVRGRRVQLAPRRASGGGASPVPDQTRRLERRAPRGRRPLCGASASARPASFRSTSPATCTTCTSFARRSVRRWQRHSACRDRLRCVLPDTAPSAARVQRARLRAGLASGDRAGCARGIALPLWAGISAGQQEQVVERVLAATAVGAAR